MALTIPPGVDVAGRRNAIFTPTNTLSVATLSGPTSVELICYLSKGTFGEAAETETGTDERECTVQAGTVPGTVTVTLNDLEYVYEPQAAASSPTNKAYDTLKEGTPGFIIVRSGILYDTALAAGDIVDQYPVILGRQNRKTPEGGAAEKFKISQPVFVQVGVLQDQVLVA